MQIYSNPSAELNRNRTRSENSTPRSRLVQTSVGLASRLLGIPPCPTCVLRGGECAHGYLSPRGKCEPSQRMHQQDLQVRRLRRIARPSHLLTQCSSKDSLKSKSRTSATGLFHSPKKFYFRIYMTPQRVSVGLVLMERGGYEGRDTCSLNPRGWQCKTRLLSKFFPSLYGLNN